MSFFRYKRRKTVRMINFGWAACRIAEIYLRKSICGAIRFVGQSPTNRFSFCEFYGRIIRKEKEKISPERRFLYEFCGYHNQETRWW